MSSVFTMPVSHGNRCLLYNSPVLHQHRISSILTLKKKGGGTNPIVPKVSSLLDHSEMQESGGGEGGKFAGFFMCSSGHNILQLVLQTLLVLQSLKTLGCVFEEPVIQVFLTVGSVVSA